MALNAEIIHQGLPNRPGVYLFKDRRGKVIYVGKAKDIKKRVTSYFRPLKDLPLKTAIMIKKAKDLGYIITSTENEAFILESNLIKELMPRYNIILRDDKRYPCLRLDINEPYPRLRMVRKIKKDGALYFGPFSSAHAARSTLKLIDRIFQLRKCKTNHLPNRSRPCLNHQLDRCLGPCTHPISNDRYQEITRQVRFFLEGRNRELINDLQKNMKSASTNLDFEKAALIRDQIRAVEKTIERQTVVSPKMEDQDVLGMAQNNGMFQLVILFVRKGYLVGSRDYLFNESVAATTEVMEAFLKQYYSRQAFIPQKVLLSEPIKELQPITEWLSALAGKRVLIHHPQKGERLRLVKMAVTNAENLLACRPGLQNEALLDQARSVMRLKKKPKSIEGLDISNIQGEMAVGTVVAFVDGLPKRSGYRNYRIRYTKGIDDHGMMSELVLRRILKGNLPDLFVVDGGKGHLSTIKKAIAGYGKGVTLDVVAIAKADRKKQGEIDKVFIPNRKNPLPLHGGHPVLLLLMRIRDEAHRRAVSYHRKLRGRYLRESGIEQIPGIGKKRKMVLLKHFGGLNAISRAKPEELIHVHGISRTLATSIFNFFHPENQEK